MSPVKGPLIRLIVTAAHIGTSVGIKKEQRTLTNIIVEINGSTCTHISTPFKLESKQMFWY